MSMKQTFSNSMLLQNIEHIIDPKPYKMFKYIYQNQALHRAEFSGFHVTKTRLSIHMLNAAKDNFLFLFVCFARIMAILLLFN